MSKILKHHGVFVIAEAGVNHNGTLTLAKKLIDAAKDAGCDAVKFQTFKAENVVSKKAYLANYQKKNNSQRARNQLELIKRLELSFDEFRELKRYCDQRKILFLSTPFDVQSADFLEQLNVAAFKISSGEITNIPFLQYIAKKKRTVILSTGMSYLKEVKEAVKSIYKAGNKDLILLHCVSEYPAPFNEINLKAMEVLYKTFHVPVGYSDHSLGIEIPLAAVALGARVIEKHLTLDRTMAGSDHQSSLEPDEFKRMVMSIRHVELALGNGIKRPAKCERRNMQIVRRSLVACQDIRKGEKITAKNIMIKRPGYGIAPKDIAKVVGHRVRLNVKKDDLLLWRNLSR